MSETLLGNIIGVASEGQGIVRYDGFVIFIPYTVTGDVVRFRIVKQKKNFALGELVEVIDPSPLRTTPPCPYFGSCGGCQLQHMRYDAQLAFKRQWVQDALNKIGGFTDIDVPPVIPTELQWHYRRRIHLVMRPQEGGYSAGYIATDNTTLIPITECRIFVDPEKRGCSPEHDESGEKYGANQVVKAVQDIASKLAPTGPEEARVTIHRISDNRFALYFHFRQMPNNIEEVCKHFHNLYEEIDGIVAASPRKTLRWGKVDSTFEIDDLKFNFSQTAFIQNHPEQSVKIYHEIESMGKKLKPSRALDLYCGVGVTTCLLGRQGIVTTGVELNEEAVRLATHNAKQSGINKVDFITADVGKVIGKLLKEHQYDMIITNPPREGMSPDVVEALCAYPTTTLVYISCMPSTLARDLKKLKSVYKIERVQPYDMFPQTAHVETVTLLSFNPK